MKIYIDCTNYIHKKTGGGNYFAHTLLKIFKDNKYFEVTIFIRNNQEIYFNKYKNYINIFKIRHSSDISILVWLNLIFPFIALKSDLVIFPHNFKPILFFKKNLLIVHDLNYLYFKDNFLGIKKKFSVFMRIYSLLTSTVNVTISDQIKIDIFKRYKRKAIRIYNCIEKSSKNYLKNEEEKRYQDLDYYLIITSLGKHKNLRNCLEAINEYHKKGFKKTFIFIGNWDKNCFRKYVNKRTLAFGYINEDFKNSLIKNADAILIPSLYEGFGLPYIEAAFAKKTLIACKIPVVKELLNDYPSYINKPYSSKDILKSIENFEEKKYLKKIISENKLEKFSTHRMKYNYFKVINFLRKI